MPTYDIESPDGKKYSVEVPEGVSGEDVVAHFMGQQSQPIQGTPTGSLNPSKGEVAQGMARQYLGDDANTD